MSQPCLSSHQTVYLNKLPIGDLAYISRQRDSSESPLHDTSMTVLAQRRCTYPSFVCAKTEQQQRWEQGRHKGVSYSQEFVCVGLSSSSAHSSMPTTWKMNLVVCKSRSKRAICVSGCVSQRSNIQSLPNPSAELTINRVCSRLQPWRSHRPKAVPPSCIFSWQVNWRASSCNRKKPWRHLSLPDKENSNYSGKSIFKPIFPPIDHEAPWR